MNTTAVQPPSLPASTPFPPRFSYWLSPAAALVLSGTVSMICLLSAGPLHGALFGATLVAALLTPVLAAGDCDWRSLLLVIAGVVVGANAGPSVAMLQGELNGRLFSTFFAVLATFVLALAGVTALLIRCQVPAAIAGAIVVVSALAWLAWPIWLSHWLPGNDSLVAILSPAHPLLTIDGAISREGGVTWLEHRIMYAKLTVLGQHVFTRRSQGVAAAALWHGTIGVISIAMAFGLQMCRVRLGRRNLREVAG